LDGLDGNLPEAAFTIEASIISLVRGKGNGSVWGIQAGNTMVAYGLDKIVDL
jgi:hypothetical protein